MKPNKENIINDILIELEKGITFSDCLALNGTKWQLSQRTFARYWKDANEAYKEVLNKRQKELADISTEVEKERLKMAILTKHERMKIASNIAQGKARKVNDQIIIPTDGDRIRALDYLAKIEGDYAPNKTDIKVSSTEINIVGKKFANEDNTE